MSVEVTCPGCQATLKAREGLTGKKAVCRKCGKTFRIPGGPPAGDSAGEAEAFSLDDATPAPGDNPFDFSAPIPPPPSPPPPSPPVATGGSKPADKAPPKPRRADVSRATPAPDPAADPFAFGTDPGTPSPSPPVAEGKPNPKEKPPRGRKERSDEPAKAKKKPDGSRPRKAGGGVGKLVLVVAVFGLVVGGVVGGVMIYLNSQKTGEHAEAEKPDEKKGGTPAPNEPTPAAKDAKAPDTTTKGEKAPPSKRPFSPRGKAAAGMPALTPDRTIAFAPPAAKPELVQGPSSRLEIVPTLPPKAEAAFPLARRVFPPLKRDNDIGVLWEAGGRFLMLGTYSPTTGKQVGKVDFLGDGQPDPACDLSAGTDLFAYADRLQGRVMVWSLKDGKTEKVIDDFDPYAAKPEHKKAGLAAVYLTDPADTLITVSTAGAVHAWKVPTKELLGEYVPPKGEPGKVVAGRAVAPGPNRQSVVLVVGGAIHAVSVKPTVAGGVVAELGGAVARPLGVAASAGGVLIVFEADAAGKKEKAVMDVRPDGNHILYRWPEKEAGEPATVGWVGGDLAMVGTTRGAVVWFDAADKGFRPLALALTPGDKARHVAADSQWTLLPDLTDAKKCVLVEFARPQEGLIDPLDTAGKKAALTVRLDEKGIHK